MKKYRVVARTKKYIFKWNFRTLRMAEAFMNLKIFVHAQMYDVNTKHCIKVREEG